MEKTKNKGIVIIIALMVGIAFCFAIPLSANAAGVKGYPGMNNIKKTSFDMYYYAKSKGTYKADLYKTNSSGKKISYIKTVIFKCTTKGNYSGYKYRGTQRFTKATPNTYYTLFPKSAGHNRSRTQKTPK